MYCYLKFIVLLLLVSGDFLFSQTLEGFVKDTTGTPVQKAVVFISYSHMTYTNDYGYYKIENIAEGNYSIKISHLSYKSVTSDLVILNPVTEKNFILEASPIELDEVVVSIDRMGNYIRNSAYSELLIGKDKLEEKPFTTLPDALKEQPGISLLRDGIWGTEINLRGLSRENIIALIDGNRIVTSTDIAARFSLIDPNDVERIEVIKGAASSIYGSGATGGIVNIITKAPLFSSSYYLNGSIAGGYNSVNNSSVTSGILYSGSSFWSAKLSGSYRNAENIQTPRGKLKNSQFEDYSLSGALSVKPFENHKIKFDYQLFKAEDVGIPGASVFPGSAEVRYPDEKREMISGGYEIQNLSKVFYKLSARYAYQYIERNVENIPHIIRLIPATETTPARRVNVLKITPGAGHKSNNIDIQANMMLSENNNLAAGIDYWDRKYRGHRENYQLIEILNSEGNVISSIDKIIGEKPLPDAESKNIGVYIQDEVVVIKNKLSFSIGARGDKIFITGKKTLNPLYEITNGIADFSPAGQKVIWNDAETENTSFSTNLGTKYSVNENLDLTLSLGLSFRSPSLEERFQYIDQGNYIRLGNPDLKPEKGKAADLGLRLYLPEVKIIASLFYNYFTDLVVEEAGVFEGRPAFIKINIGKAKLYGFDLRADYNFYRDLIFYASASYVKGDDISLGRDLPGIPPLNINTGIRTHIFNKLEAEFSTNIFARQNEAAAGETITPGYAVFNLAVNTMPVDFSFVTIRFYSGVENIFDKAYRNHLSTTRGSLMLEPGRNFYLRLVTQW